MELKLRSHENPDTSGFTRTRSTWILSTHVTFNIRGLNRSMLKAEIIRKPTFSVLVMVLVFFTGPDASAQLSLWGMTKKGANGLGVIFKTDDNGKNEQVVYKFPESEGAEPGYIKLCEAANGKLYGTTFKGGANNHGVLFEYDPSTNTYTKKFDFSDSAGISPNSAMIKASNGKLYGMTYMGGANGQGVIYEYDPSTNTYTKKFDFNGTDGSNPEGYLTEATNGKLYGITNQGGADSVGVLFEYDTATNMVTKKFDFTDSTGSLPYGSLMQASNGKMYGLTHNGGANNLGVIYEFDPATGIYTKKFDLVDSLGAVSFGTLTEAANGKLYGMTYSGGANGYGTLFEYDPSTDTYTKKFDFSDTSGGYPFGTLLRSTNDTLYGLTYLGGVYHLGVLFKYDVSTDTYTKIYDFNLNDGNYPQSSLMEASDGKIYGLTSSGGTAGLGTIFEYDPSTGATTNKISIGNKEGYYPLGGLIRTPDGKFYGMTEYGGSNDKGVLFEFDPDSEKYMVKFNFSDINGSNPTGTLTEADNGKLYGLTSSGGVNNVGVLFEYDPQTDSYSKDHDFISSTGYNPIGSLLKASNGKLYGVTSIGGTHGTGTLFEYDPGTGSYTDKYDFLNTSGSGPYASLAEASNGKLYGTTRSGGANGNGVLFEYDPGSNTYSDKIDLNDSTGYIVYGALTEASNGKLYGTTVSGGSNGKGVIFEYDPANGMYSKKFDFIDSTGIDNLGTLMEASNGKLYGMSDFGGANYFGVLFQYDYMTNTYTDLLDFDDSNGGYPNRAQLLEVCTPIHDTIDTTVCSSYTSPDGKYTWTATGNYVDTIPGVGGCDSIMTIHLTVSPLNFNMSISVNTLKTAISGATYQWLDCDNNDSPVAGATGQTFTPTMDGNYAVAVTKNGCTDTSACINMQLINSINAQILSEDFRIYPNPAKDRINIDKTQADVIELKVYDMIGTLVLTKKLDARHNIIDISNLNPGVYYMEANGFREKLIKE